MNNISYIILACYPDKGMKSHGSKSLMIFNNQKLLDHQIKAIHNFNKKNTSYEIIVISSFDTIKIQKNFHKIKVVNCLEHNPIYTGCLQAKYKKIVFIDYGCVFNEKTLSSIKFDNSSILCLPSTKDSAIDVGCVSDQSSNLINMFFDLPNNKFCNIFYINEYGTNKIISDIKYSIKNLLYFEIINMLVSTNEIFKISNINSNNFIYFNNMRQKNAITKFYK